MIKISSKITNYLNKNKYKYEIMEHRTTYTAWDTAQTEKVKPIEVAKALVLRADKEIVLAVLPANRNLDKNKFLKVLNAQRKKEKLKPVKSLKWVEEAWMKKNLPGKVGAVPPFAGLLKVPLYLDALMTKSKKIYVGSGEYKASIRVLTSQYIKIEQPIKGNFSVKK